MQKVIRETDEKRGIVQVTIADERWYLKQIDNPKTGIPEYKGVPSSTWISDSYPKGVFFYKWLAEKGWDEAEAVKQAAGDKGSKVHLAIEAILRGEEVRIDSKFVNKKTGQEEELTLEECDCILSFKKWFKDTEEEYQITPIVWEKTIFSEIHNYAGTIDFICMLQNKKTKESIYWIMDWKTGQSIWKSSELQVSSYKKAIESGENEVMFQGKQIDVSNIKIGILQLGYRRNKDGYKFTELEDKFDLFLTAQKIWKEEHGDEKPNKKDYPIILSPAVTVEEALKTNENK